jgi:aspartate aminotransferase
VIDAACRIQSQVLGNPCTISQAATLTACELPLPDEQTRRMSAFEERRRYLVTEINKIPGMRLTAPRGAFYALVDVREIGRKKGLDDVQICERLLDDHLLAAVPGSAFAIPGFLRLSYAAAMDLLQKAVARLRAFAESK